MVSGILILVIIGIATVMSIQNATVVSMSFLRWRFETTLPMIIFGAILSGVVVAQLVRRLMAGRGDKERKA